MGFNCDGQDGLGVYTLGDEGSPPLGSNCDGQNGLGVYKTMMNVSCTWSTCFNCDGQAASHSSLSPHC